jgi:peptide/nickel transport system permease protein
MLAFLIRKILYSIPVVLGVAAITLWLFTVASGDPTAMRLGKNPSAAEQQAARAELGLDKPFYERYVTFLGDVATGDFGNSWNDNTPVRTIFKRGIGPTLMLSIPAFLLGALIAVSLALLVAFYRGSLLDKTMTMLAIAGISVSSLIYILVGQWLFADQWKLFPIWGFEYGAGGVVFLVLPILIWVVLSVGTDLRYFRTVALEEISRDYIRTARSKGLSETRVLFKHVLRNCSIPIITRLTIVVPFLITGSFLMEIFFGIPGLGSQLYQSIQNSDLPVVMAFTMLGTILYVTFNILADILYALFDPRVRF